MSNHAPMNVSSATSPSLLPKDAESIKTKTIEQTYTKMEQHEHILNRPDMYIGSTRRVSDELYVWDESTKSIIFKTVKYSPGLYKIFDEVLVNAADNFQRDPSMKFIKVEINREEGMISVHNDGDGIPIEMHKIHNKYVPELIFGDLLTGSSFDDSDAKVTGGRNGLGAKLANIYSHQFDVEVRCKGRSFQQRYSKNMFIRSVPAIQQSAKGADFTKISFKPDLKRFDGMSCFDDDIVALFTKRVYDIAGCNTKLNVFLNGVKIDIKTFKDYVALYFVSKPEEERAEIIGTDIVVDRSSGKKRWEIAFAVSDGDFKQVSFVNSIWTIRGGNHVQAAVKHISDYLAPKIKKKNKGTEIKPAMVKSHMFLFINCLLNNPEFDSQTKETLKSAQSSWGTKLELSESFLNRLSTKSGIIQQILSWNSGRSANVLKTVSKKQKGRLGISKLTEANFAASSKSSQCTLIVTEGDSAKGLALAGLSVVGRDKYGVFPLRGKVLNVRNAVTSKIIANEEINMIIKTMGLQHQKVYTDVSSLRYGRIMIMTDQDTDGSHIKGLFINFIHHFWPSLFKIPGFLCEFVTPIVKATKGDRIHSFFTIPQYEDWCRNNNNSAANKRGWVIKYYKGLGTSEPAEMQDYFSDLPKHEKHFKYVGGVDDDAIQLAFLKKAADGRKEWLASFIPGTQLDQSLVNIPYHEFINKELILFSMEDCERSIASMVDGFKPGQRKIMFACFKRNLKGDIKIAQLAGYVLEHCAYHHGEVSLYSTMIGMAQNFVGANNINLLEPVGSFGTRDQGGKDAAAPRYIFTTLSPLTRYIFHPDDDHVLDYLSDEGINIQPQWYCPVVPMILINGNAGIGTGWSSDVPNYNPIDVVANIRRLINNLEPLEMHPWYRGFNGIINYDSKKNRYICKGVWKRLDHSSIEITELPIGSWTQQYKDNLEEMIIAQDNDDKKVKKMMGSNKKNKKDGYDSDNDESEKKKPAVVKKKSNAAPVGRPSKVKKDDDCDGGGDDDDDERGGGKEDKKKNKSGANSFKGMDIKDFKEYHTTTRVHFVIFSPSFAAMSDEEIEKRMKLTSSISTTNMHLFGADGRIKKYPSPVEILKDFFIVRIGLYVKRKQFLIDRIARDLIILKNKMRFIKDVTDKTIIVSGRKKFVIFAELKTKLYAPYPPDIYSKNISSNVELIPIGEEGGDGSSTSSEISGNNIPQNQGDYDYLLSMPIWSVTHERYVGIVEQVKSKELELSIVRSIHPADLWERDLDSFLDAWSKFESNMKILDECGVGGSAFRKPTPPPLKETANGNGKGSGGNKMVIKPPSNHDAFKRLQKLAPFSSSSSSTTTITTISPSKNRVEIILPSVKTEPIVPPKENPKKIISTTTSTTTIAKTKTKSSPTVIHSPENISNIIRDSGAVIQLLEDEYGADIVPSPSSAPAPVHISTTLSKYDSDEEFGLGQSTAYTLKRNHMDLSVAPDDIEIELLPSSKRPFTLQDSYLTE